MEKNVYIVHCIDTEGPLKETIDVTFERLKDIFGIEFDPSYATIKKLQNQLINLNGIEEDVAKVISKELLAYNDKWENIDKMLEELLSKKFRNQLLDSIGNVIVANINPQDGNFSQVQF